MVVTCRNETTVERQDASAIQRTLAFAIWEIRCQCRIRQLLDFFVFHVFLLVFSQAVLHAAAL
jgi:hypothetical protein